MCASLLNLCISGDFFLTKQFEYKVECGVTGARRFFNHSMFDFSPVKKAELGGVLLQLDAKHSRISVIGTIFLFKSVYSSFNMYVKAEPSGGRK